MRLGQPSKKSWQASCDLAWMQDDPATPSWSFPLQSLHPMFSWSQLWWCGPECTQAAPTFDSWSFILQSLHHSLFITPNLLLYHSHGDVVRPLMPILQFPGWSLCTCGGKRWLSCDVSWGESNTLLHTAGLTVHMFGRSFSWWCESGPCPRRLPFSVLRNLWMPGISSFPCPHPSSQTQQSESQGKGTPRQNRSLLPQQQWAPCHHPPLVYQSPCAWSWGCWQSSHNQSMSLSTPHIPACTRSCWYEQSSIIRRVFLVYLLNSFQSLVWCQHLQLPELWPAIAPSQNKWTGWRGLVPCNNPASDHSSCQTAPAGSHSGGSWPSCPHERTDKTDYFFSGTQLILASHIASLDTELCIGLLQVNECKEWLGNVLPQLLCQLLVKDMSVPSAALRTLSQPAARATNQLCDFSWCWHQWDIALDSVKVLPYLSSFSPIYTIRNLSWDSKSVPITVQPLASLACILPRTSWLFIKFFMAVSWFFKATPLLLQSSVQHTTYTILCHF